MATHATRMSSGVATLRRAGTAAALMAVVTLGADAAPAQAAPGGDTTVSETLFKPGAGASQSATATCPAGSRVVGGGASNGTSGEGVQVSGPVTMPQAAAAARQRATPVALGNRNRVRSIAHRLLGGS